MFAVVRILVLSAVSFTLLSGCASIVSSWRPQELPISSIPEGAALEVIDAARDNKVITKATTPYTSILERSGGFFKRGKYVIKVSKEGFIPREANLEAGINGWYFGNLILGGAIGLLIVDPATGAMFKIDETNLSLKLYEDTSEGKKLMAKEVYNGEYYFKEGMMEKAIEDISKGLLLYPDNPAAFAARANCYSQLGDKGRAVEDLSRAIDLCPDTNKDKILYYKQRSELYLSMSSLEKSCEDAQRMLNLDPNSADGYHLRSMYYYKNEKKELANSDFQKAVSLGHQ